MKEPWAMSHTTSRRSVADRGNCNATALKQKREEGVQNSGEAMWSCMNDGGGEVVENEIREVRGQSTGDLAVPGI